MPLTITKQHNTLFGYNAIMINALGDYGTSTKLDNIEIYQGCDC